jgi:hypothetical protein
VPEAPCLRPPREKWPGGLPGWYSTKDLLTHLPTG